MKIKLIDFINRIKRLKIQEIATELLKDTISNIDVNEGNIVIRTIDYSLELDFEHKGD